MSQSNNRSSLFGALFVPALIFGGLIIVALIIISFRSGSDAPTRSAGGDNVRTLDDSVLAQFRNEFDAVGEAVGDPDAPVTIREFADYQCPACAAFAPTAERIRNELVESGKARFVFFDFPLPMHEHAREAAIAARCAGRQNAFWAYHQRLFDNQRQWARAGDATSMFLDMAVESGINAERLDACITQGGTDDVIARNIDAGRAVGLRATPTVIVGDQLFSGAIDYQRVRQAVEQQTP